MNGHVTSEHLQSGTPLLALRSGISMIEQLVLSSEICISMKTFRYSSL